MIKRLRNNKAETYIDVAITVMIVAFVLVFAVNMVSIVALNQNNLPSVHLSCSSNMFFVWRDRRILH